MPACPPVTILIVEDDPATARLVELYLKNEGFRTCCAADGRGGIEAARRERPSLVVLDLMLPGLDGWQVCRTLRAESRVPILILTARDREDDRVQGLTLGADDYVVKPFSPKELVARVKAILRRASPAAADAPGAQELVCGPLSIDAEQRIVRLGGEPVALTPSEFTLLQALMANPGRVFSRRELVARLYPSGNDVVEKVIDVHVGELRQKIERDRTRPHFVQTVRGFGYRFAPPAAAGDDA